MCRLQAHEGEDDVRQGQERECHTGQLAEQTVLRETIGGDRGAAFIICDSQKVGRESRKLCYLPGHAPQPYGCMPRIRAVESRQIVMSVLRHHGPGGVPMAPTAYATAADDVSKSARL